MALSRFWLGLFLCSVAYLLFLLFSGRYYDIGFAVNGKKDDALLKRVSTPSSNCRLTCRANCKVRPIKKSRSAAINTRSKTES